MADLNINSSLTCIKICTEYIQCMYRSNSALITTTPGSALPKNKQTPRLVAGLSPWPGRR